MARSRSTRNTEPRIVEQITNPSDDEEIDEDEAFNSEDELMYGELFLGAKKKGKKKSRDDDRGRAKQDGGESVDGSDEDEESGRDDGEDSAGSSDSSDEDRDSDGEDEDDDGGQYMLDLLNNLDNKGGNAGNDGGSGKSSVAAEAAARLPESEFRAGALSALSSGSGGDGKLTLDSLMDGITDTADFAAVQKSMRALAGGEGHRAPAAVPAARVVSDRASRKVHAAAAVEEAGGWQDAVHEQRDAETLDFRTSRNGTRTNKVTRDTLVDKFEATNDFERELQEALEAAGVEDEGEMGRRERRRLTGRDEDDGDAADAAAAADDLGSGRLTLAEYRQRRGELAKLRALMFYEEQKRHRINKIKSKKYRKIRKRQRDRLREAEGDHAEGEGDAEAARERVEQEEMARMRERMTLAHRNTSKWAKRVLRRGAKMDPDERRALSLQIAKGEELRRKAHGASGEEEEESEEETDEGLLRQARQILMETEDADDGKEDGAAKGKKKGLFELEFMKRGMEAQRLRAKEEAQKLLEELEETQKLAAVSSSDEGDASDEDGEERNSAKKPRVATEAETNEVLPEGALVASALQFGRGGGFAVRVDTSIDLDGDRKERPEHEAGDRREEPATAAKRKRKKKKKKKERAQEAKDAAASNTAPASASKGTESAMPTSDTRDREEEEENPWLTAKSSAHKARKRPSATVNVGDAGAMLVDGNVRDGSSGKKPRPLGDGVAAPATPSEREPQKEETAKRSEAAATATEGAGGAVVKAVADLSQAELVRHAFAAPADLAADEFEKEKVGLSLALLPVLSSWCSERGMRV